MHRLKALAASTALAGSLGLGIAATPAGAQQAGLVNIDLEIEDNVVNVQVPVAIAANICDVNVAVLAQDLADDGEANCTADADNTVEFIGGRP